MPFSYFNNSVNVAVEVPTDVLLLLSNTVKSSNKTALEVELFL